MKAKVYAYRFRALPVTFHLRTDHRFHWTHIVGVQIGAWFFGAIRGRAVVPDDEPKL